MSTAAQYYFDKSISQLNSHEILYLVSLINRDQDSDQVVIAKALQGVLQNLKNNGDISEQETKTILSEPVLLSHHDSYKKAPFITDYILDTVFTDFGSRFVTKNGLKIYTTVDLNTQNQLQQIVSENAWRTPGNSSVTLFIINTQNGEVIGAANSNIYNTAEEKKYLVERVLSLYTGLTSHSEKPNPVTLITDASGKILYKNNAYYSPIANIDTSIYSYNEMKAVFIGDYAVASVIHDPAQDKASYMYLVHSDVLNAAKNRILRTFVQPNQHLNAHR